MPADVRPPAAAAAPARSESAPEARSADPLPTPPLADPLPAWFLPTFVYRFCDTATMLVVLMGSLVASNLDRMPTGVEGFLAVRLSLKNVLLLAFFTVAWRGICSACGLYNPRRIASGQEECARVAIACLLVASVAILFLFTSVSGAFDVLALVLFCIGMCTALLVVRLALRVLARAHSRPKRNVLIVGSGPRALDIVRQLRANPRIAFNVLGFVDSESTEAMDGAPCRLVARLEDFESTLMHSGVDEVLVGLPLRSHYAHVERVIETCERLGVPVTLPADSFPHARAKFRPRRSEELLAVTWTDSTRDVRHVVKRVIDLVGASVMLVVLSPLIVLIAVLVKLTSRGPVLYVQQRYGYNRYLFGMFKFRTMVANAETMLSAVEHLNEAPGPLFKIHNDPRITPIGKLLRRTSMDELPQLLNVLSGEMSLVGPRPMSIRDVHQFTESSLMRRFSVIPGMTGLWQIQGRNRLGYEEWASLDLSYVENWSLSADLKILALTVPAVIRGTGAE
jgi:exopolysaccharide biosynthesis polyprenyl glycosylphosphotransferase